MLKYSLDLGGSTIDMVFFDTQNKTVIQTFSTDSKIFPTKDISAILEYFQVQDNVINLGKLYITGGKSESLPSSIVIKSIEIQIHVVHEFEAIARGAAFLSNEETGLAISMGTGTAMVSFNKKKWNHVKGTGIGGGTFLALGRALLQTDDFDELAELVSHGKKENIDLSIEDIIGGSIGKLPKDATASNFAKYSHTTSKYDIAIGIANLISQSIVTLAVEKALRLGHTKIIIGGKFSRLEILKENILETCKFFDIHPVFPQHSGFMTCIGASLSKI